MTETYKDLYAQSGLSLVRSLAQASQGVRDAAGAASTLPFVRIEFNSGLNYEGYVWGFVENSNEKSLLFLQFDSRANANQPKSFSFLDLNHSFNLSFLQPDVALNFFRTGGVPAWSSDQEINSLQLKREMAALQQEIAKSFNIKLQYNPENIGANTKENVILRDVAAGVKTYFQKTSKDSLGQEAMKKITGVSLNLKVGSELSVKKSGNEILIEVDLKKALPDQEKFYARLDELL